LEDGVANASERAATGAIGGDGGEIAIGASFGLMADVALFLERLQRGEHGRVREIFLERVAHFGHTGGAEAPQDAHDGQLTRGEVDLVHGDALLSTGSSVDYDARRGLSTVFSVERRKSACRRVTTRRLAGARFFASL